mgnify:CR=1 FL=1
MEKMDSSSKIQEIINEDCIAGMKKLEDNSVDIIICDPPYNIGKDFGNDSDKQKKNGSKGNYKYLIDNIMMQKLDKRIKIHKIDLKKINEFFKKKENRAIYFKLVYFDCGIYDVVKPAIRNIWKRVVPGGIIIFDQLYHALAPGETKAKNELLSEYKSYKLDFSWMPTAYIVKEKK